MSEINYDNNLCIFKLNDRALTPHKGTPYSAGYDLFAIDEYKINPWDKVIVKTGLQIRTPVGYYGRIASRSGLSVKKNIEVGAGVIDHDYQGEVCVILRNFSNETVEIKTGERCAQIILEPYASVDIKKLNNPLDYTFNETVRNSGGFGSTGTN
jgi:dUTP pyrophosphatase